ncbi:hypothetical protein [Phycicoccus flavus]|uniref:hypothetical protein n=1 Tax=Phycicoccus flavus TaxID=2502783 RepID=UPI000FEB6EA6|nr:hypothetical protein [Phycicoccus flavus]NHA66909.1 hypothetical protein [Phycicoccus flavus]
MDRVGSVVVDGWGPLAARCASQLRGVGVSVRTGAHAADAAELEVAGGAAAPAAVVLVAEVPPAPWGATPSMLAPWHAAGVPHLPLVAVDGRVVVGPLVVPGRSACLACVGDAAAADPASSSPGPLLRAGALTLAAAVATVTVLAVLRGDVEVAGISTEIGRGGTSVTHRVWSARPGCRCLALRRVG